VTADLLLRIIKPLAAIRCTRTIATKPRRTRDLPADFAGNRIGLPCLLHNHAHVYAFHRISMRFYFENIYPLNPNDSPPGPKPSLNALPCALRALASRSWPGTPMARLSRDESVPYSPERPESAESVSDREALANASWFCCARFACCCPCVWARLLSNSP